jgi:hypothetical protein
VDDREPFISRWSRRKLQAKEDAPAGIPQASAPPAAAAAPLPPAAEPPGPGTAARSGPEYKEFFDPRVDEQLRRTALKNLFSDPHFNVMDGLDTYIDDYSKPDPIPEAMLRQLNQAKDLLLFDDEKQSDASVGDAAPVASGDAVPAAAAGAPAPSEPPAAGASDGVAGGAANAAAAPLRESIKNA